MIILHLLNPSLHSSRLPSKSGCKGKKKLSLIPNENQKKERKKFNHSTNSSKTPLSLKPSA
jgi:hypothetical protein